MLALLVPGAALAAVTPAVTKLRLTDLDETGSVVGRLSGISTAGAIAGTVVTGFVLITHVPVSVILVGLGVALVVTAVVVEVWLRRARPGAGPRPPWSWSCWRAPLPGLPPTVVTWRPPTTARS